jgi:2-dehydropantoate 2-reductase
MVRPPRAEHLARGGPRIVSPHGDFTVSARTVLASGLREPFDLVLPTVKSYAFSAAMEQFALAVGPARGMARP